MEVRQLKEGEIVKKDDEIRWRPDGSYGLVWEKVPSLYVGKPKRILSNPIRRIK